MADVAVWLRDPSGVLLMPGLPVTVVEWTLEENAFGVLRVSGPLAELDTSLLRLDCRLDLMRSIEGAPPYIEGNAPFLLRWWDFGEDEQGAETYSLEAYTPEYLLTGRIIDSFASTEDDTNALTTKTGTADDIAKELVDENIVNATTTIRNVTGLSCAADQSQGASTTKSCSYDNLWDVLLDLAEDSQNQGTYLSYGIIYRGNNLKFVTYCQQRGTWRDIIVSKDMGNLRSPRVEYDHREAITAVRAAGKGEGRSRRTVRVEDAERAAASPYAYREAFHDDTRAETDDALNADARAELQRGTAKRKFTGQYVDVLEYSVYGRELNFGDRLRAYYRGESYTVRLSRVRGTYDRENGETLEIDLEGTETI